MNLQNKNSRTKILKLHNLIADYPTNDLEQDKQSSSTLWNARLRRAGKTDSTGFIPMIIMIVLVLAVFIWLVYSRVSHAH